MRLQTDISNLACWGSIVLPRAKGGNLKGGVEQPLHKGFLCGTGRCVGEIVGSVGSAVCISKRGRNYSPSLQLATL